MIEDASLAFGSTRVSIASCLDASILHHEQCGSASERWHSTLVSDENQHRNRRAVPASLFLPNFYQMYGLDVRIAAL